MFGFTIGSFRRDRGSRPAYRQSCETPIISRVTMPLRMRGRLLIFNPVSNFPVIEAPRLEESGNGPPDREDAERNRNRLRDGEREHTHRQEQQRTPEQVDRFGRSDFTPSRQRCAERAAQANRAGGGGAAG